MITVNPVSYFDDELSSAGPLDNYTYSRCLLLPYKDGIPYNSLGCVDVAVTNTGCYCAVTWDMGLARLNMTHNSTHPHWGRFNGISESDILKLSNPPLMSDSDYQQDNLVDD